MCHLLQRCATKGEKLVIFLASRLGKCFWGRSGFIWSLRQRMWAPDGTRMSANFQVKQGWPQSVRSTFLQIIRPSVTWGHLNNVFHRKCGDIMCLFLKVSVLKEYAHEAFIDFKRWTLRVCKRCAEILKNAWSPSTTMINHCIKIINKWNTISMCWCRKHMYNGRLQRFRADLLKFYLEDPKAFWETDKRHILGLWNQQSHPWNAWI